MTRRKPFGLDIKVEQGATSRNALTHNERLVLMAEIDRFIFRVHPRHPWGGALIVRDVDTMPENGRRTHKHHPWDEQAGFYPARGQA